MFERLLRRLGLDGQSRQRTRMLAGQIEQLIDACDKRLRLVPGYLDALTPGMRASQAYLSTLMAQLPPVLTLSLPSFSRDPRLGLLFAGPSSLLELLDGSGPLHEFFLSAGNGDEAWALLTMQRSETSRFGVAMENGELRNDVAQVVVSFDGHRLVMPSPSQEQFRRNSGAHALEVMTSVIARRLSLLEQARQQLEAEQARLQLRRLSLQSDRCVVVDCQASDACLPETAAGVDARLAEIGPQLDELRGQASLDGLLRTVREVLEQPADYFSLQTVTLRLNRMGIKVGRDDEATDLTLEEVVLGKAMPVRRALLPVRVHRHDIAELRRQFGAD
ncbi:hypothetical protein [Chromobacterium sphagni]|uniref:Uncharacterized protein n=1 Tax=Chromobacterium sphagni TaxID=1903179 RepID=A0ABX3C7B4_9NEIS|nr:hypothetical protein [Chromobacterium sphagni]OHX15427.1 hypothetical protein BI344_22150 [Chromobacterium sphagni]